jgi:AcrR family transcriptional regulator
MELIQEHGFEALRVQDIAERATITHATFYADLEDKYSLLDTLIKEQFANEMTRRLPLETALTGTNLRALASAIFLLLDELDRHCRPTGPSAQTRPNIEAAMQRELAVYLTAWLRRAAPESVTHAPEITTAASVMSWAIFGAGLEWSRGGRTDALDVAVGRLVATLVDGVSQTAHIVIPR